MLIKSREPTKCTKRLERRKQMHMNRGVIAVLCDDTEQANIMEGLSVTVLCVGDRIGTSEFLSFHSNTSDSHT